jgi:hypothetical protein
MAIAIPPSVSSVLRRLRQRFFHANHAKESWEAMTTGKILENCAVRLVVRNFDKEITVKVR